MKPFLVVLVFFAALAAGVSAGIFLAPTPTLARTIEPEDLRADGERADRAELRALLQALSEEVGRLRGELALRRAATVPANAEPPSTRAVEDGAPSAASARGSAREALGRSPIDDARIAAIDRRLKSIEVTQQALLALSRANSRQFEPGVPPGTPVRDYLGALKQHDGAAEAHRMFSMQQVQELYGIPDEVQDRGDYIEWIYRLPEEGEQFDFHFVNGLCVQAH